MRCTALYMLSLLLYSYYCTCMIPHTAYYTEVYIFTLNVYYDNYIIPIISSYYICVHYIPYIYIGLPPVKVLLDPMIYQPHTIRKVLLVGSGGLSIGRYLVASIMTSICIVYSI